jgi:hypothetical protein
MAEQEVFFLHSILRDFSSLLLNAYWSCVPNGKAAGTLSGPFSLSTAKVKNAQMSQPKYECPQPKGAYLECCEQQHMQAFLLHCTLCPKSLPNMHHNRTSLAILSWFWVTIDGICTGDSIYWPLLHTNQNYKQLQPHCWSPQFTNHHCTC